MLVLNRYIIFLFASFSFLYSTSLVFNPYGDMNTSDDDTDFATYLDFVSHNLLSQQQFRDSVSFPVASSSAVGYRPSQDLSEPDKFYITSPDGSGRSTEYDMYGPSVWWSSLQAFDDGTHNAIDITNFILEERAWQDAIYDSFQSNLLGGIYSYSGYSSNALASIFSGITTSTVLQVDTNGKLDAIATLIDRQGLGDFAVSSGIADVNNKLQDIENLLKTSPDGSEIGGVNDAIGGMESLLNGADFSYLDNFRSNIEQTVNDVTAIKDDFNDAIALVNGDIPPINLGGSGGSCASIAFTLMRQTYYPISNLPNILSRYSAVFTFFAYISLMLLNFRFLFKFFALSK